MDSRFKQGVLSINNLTFPQKYVGKQKDNIVFRSSYELSFVKYCDRNPNILSWSSEETQIMYIYSLDKRWHRYFPDFYIKYKDHKENIKEAIVEIKPYAQTQKPILEHYKKQEAKDNAIAEYIKNMDKWKAAKLWCKEHGMHFMIITEKDIHFGKC